MVSDNYLPRTPRHWASYGRSIYRVPRAKRSTRSLCLRFSLVSVLFPHLVFLSLLLFFFYLFVPLFLTPTCSFFLLPSSPVVSTVSLEIGSNVMIIPVLRPRIRSFRGIRISFESRSAVRIRHYQAYSYNSPVSLTNNYEHRM